VPKKKKYLLDFEVDKLTNSIENVVTGDSFETDILLLRKSELKSINRNAGWLFDWKVEFNEVKRSVFKLTISNNPKIIQGLLSIEERQGYIYMHLLESAPFNRGEHKMYVGVPGNLVAFACRKAFQLGFDGVVSFTAKTQLISHYQKTLGATQLRRESMFIDTADALRLVNQYFKS
jgi:hypothetical protein